MSPRKRYPQSSDAAQGNMTLGKNGNSRQDVVAEAHGHLKLEVGSLCDIFLWPLSHRD